VFGDEAGGDGRLPGGGRTVQHDEAGHGFAA
jgi:hypothetical protein